MNWQVFLSALLPVFGVNSIVYLVVAAVRVVFRATMERISVRFGYGELLSALARCLYLWVERTEMQLGKYIKSHSAVNTEMCVPQLCSDAYVVLFHASEHKKLGKFVRENTTMKKLGFHFTKFIETSFHINTKRK